MLSNIRAVAFDLDDTLWDIQPVIERAETRLRAWMQEHCPRLPERWSIEEMREARMQLARDEPDRAHDYSYLRVAILTRHVVECGYDESMASRAFEVFTAARNDIDVFADVRPALERLKARYVLGTLSNGNADLKCVGIADLFHTSLNARQVGVAKPHPLGFRQLAQALSLAPEQVLYVGDDPALDVEAARAAGLRTAWMNRREILWPAGIAAADLIVSDCHGLASHLLTDA